jgi:hypothetical protein
MRAQQRGVSVLTAALRQHVLPRHTHLPQLGLQQVALAREGDLPVQPRAPWLRAAVFTAGGVEHELTATVQAEGEVQQAKAAV